MASHVDTFRSLHHEGCFLIPNPFDVGSARLFEAAGHVALATTSSGFAATTGRLDGAISADELLDHSSKLTASVEIPVSVDAERCYGDDAASVEDFVSSLGQTGASGCSIEDWNPAAGRCDDIGPATDIYCLGATMYALFTGHPPFQGNSVAEVVKKIRNEEPMSLKSHMLGVPETLEAINIQMLAKDPEDRFQTAHSLLKALENYAKSHNLPL